MNEWLDAYFMCKNQFCESGYRAYMPWKTDMSIWIFMVGKELPLHYLIDFHNSLVNYITLTIIPIF